MAGGLRLQTHHTPSIFNKDMLLGGLLGGMAVGLIGATGGVALALFAAAPAAAALIGGLIGKHRMEIENREGKVVGEKSFWNKDTLIGGLVGWQAAGLVALGALGTTLATAAALPAAAPVIIPGGLTLAVLGAVAAPLAGGYIGGKIGEKRMGREYEEAKKQNILQHVSRTASPEVAQAVEYTMANKKDWATRVMEEKLLAAAQEPQR